MLRSPSENRRSHGGRATRPPGTEAEPAAAEGDDGGDAEPEEPLVPTDHSDPTAGWDIANEPDEPDEPDEPEAPEDQEPPERQEASWELEQLENSEESAAPEELDSSVEQATAGPELQDAVEEYGESEAPGEAAEPRGSAEEEDSPEPAEPERSEEPAEGEEPEGSGDPDDELPELELELKPYGDSVPYSVAYTSSLRAEAPDDSVEPEAPAAADEVADVDDDADDSAVDDSAEPEASEAPDDSVEPEASADADEAADVDDADDEPTESAESDPEISDEPGEPEAPDARPDSLADVNEGWEEAEHPEGPDTSDGLSDGTSGDTSARVLPREFESNEEGAEYGREQWKEAQEQLTPEQYEALQGYTDEKGPEDRGAPDYKEINGSLRGYVEGTREIDESIARMDEAMELQPAPENLMVLRETGLDAFNCPVDELQGSIQSDPGYLSTALGSEATFNPGAEAVIHLEVPEGTPAMYMEGLSHYDSERELLLGRGLEYEITDEPDYDGDRWHIYGRVLPQVNDRGE